MQNGRCVTIEHDETPRNAAAVYLGNVFDALTAVFGQKQEGFTALLGFYNSDQNVTIDIYQGSHADVDAITTIAPAAGTGNGKMFLSTFAFVGSATGAGLPISVPIRGPSLRARVTVGGVNQTTAELCLAAVQ